MTTFRSIPLKKEKLFYFIFCLSFLLFSPSLSPVAGSLLFSFPFTLFPSYCELKRRSSSFHLFIFYFSLPKAWASPDRSPSVTQTQPAHRRSLSPYCLSGLFFPFFCHFLITPSPFRIIQPWTLDVNSNPFLHSHGPQHLSLF